MRGVPYSEDCTPLLEFCTAPDGEEGISLHETLQRIDYVLAFVQGEVCPIKDTDDFKLGNQSAQGLFYILDTVRHALSRAGVHSGSLELRMSEFYRAKYRD